MMEETDERIDEEDAGRMLGGCWEDAWEDAREDAEKLTVAALMTL